MQPPPAAPPQWSADGQWWWDGSGWRARSELVAPPASTYWKPPPGYALPQTFQMPPPIDMRPSPGLRIVLLTTLAIVMLITGLFSLFGVLGVAGGARSNADIELAALFVILFATSTLALVGVAVRSWWSRWVAIVVGVVLTLTCLGSVFGIPILITAARAPDLKRAT